MSNRTLDFLITAKETAVPVIARVEQRVKQLNKQIEDAAVDKVAKRQLGIGGGGWLDSLNESFGKSSDLGKIAKLAAGSGAIFALSKVTHEIAAMAEAGEKMATAIRKGEGNAGELSLRFAESLPILGSIVKAGGSINEIITGDKLALEEANKEAENSVALTARMRENMKATTLAAEGFKDQLSSIIEERAKIIGKPIPREAIEFGESAVAAVQKRADEGRKLIEPVLNPKGADSFEALLEKQRKLKRDISLTFVPEFTVESTTAGYKNNQKEVDDAKKKLADLKNQLAPIDREIQLRRGNAGPLIDAKWHNELQEIKNQGLRVVSSAEDMWAEITGSVHKALIHKSKEMEKEDEKDRHELRADVRRLKEMAAGAGDRFANGVGDEAATIGTGFYGLFSALAGKRSPGKPALISTQLPAGEETNLSGAAQAARERLDLMNFNRENERARLEREHGEAIKAHNFAMKLFGDNIKNAVDKFATAVGIFYRGGGVSLPALFASK